MAQAYCHWIYDRMLCRLDRRPGHPVHSHCDAQSQVGCPPIPLAAIAASRRDFQPKQGLYDATRARLEACDTREWTWQLRHRVHKKPLLLPNRRCYPPNRGLTAVASAVHTPSRRGCRQQPLQRIGPPYGAAAGAHRLERLP